MEDTFLSFDSAGWFPEPSVFWTDENDRNVTEGTETNIALGEDGLYRIRTALSCLLIITDLHIVIPKSNVTGPYQGETVLPCHFYFDHKVPPESIILHWWRHDIRRSTPIYVFENNQRQKQAEDPDYSNRTELYYDIQLGDASLKMWNLRLQDSGQYICDVWSEGYSRRRQGRVELSVAAKPSKVGHISQKGKCLHFNSTGWFPEPFAFWTNENDSIVTEHNQTSITQREDDLYSISTVLEPTSGWRSRSLHLCYTNPDTGERQTDVYHRAAKSSGDNFCENQE
ncbi:hypothetical protein SKAU_G00418780 [Synaphobranchus kaupii]|uniref:Ig-like domain-containing protein n=1 Tax=Synaphobranchus kaupii TaxID=118154 RepID=A0A9Q1E683_SYNKA|nr:hypothetical protein SKAU_G00418780 [Synaphobranchus kaupii]